MDASYNNAAAVDVLRRDRYVAGWTSRSNALRQTPGGEIDLRYGGGARQRLDFFSCGRRGAPPLAYIHGGYWQMNGEESYAFFGEALLPADFNLALIEILETLARPAGRLLAALQELAPDTADRRPRLPDPHHAGASAGRARIHTAVSWNTAPPIG